jgi:hypothetical protein
LPVFPRAITAEAACAATQTRVRDEP